MSLARAFTSKRPKRPEISAPTIPQRSLTTKHSFASGTIRNKISAPVELISTTNMLSYNAPDIYPSSSASSHSGDESERSRSPTNASSPTTSPDSSSIEASPPCSPEPNHLSCYFGGAAGRQSTSSDDAPVVPKRALSHTKKTHEIVHRTRSIQRLSSPKNSVSHSRSSMQMFNSVAEAEPESQPQPHPFGNELAQVSELAEEFAAHMDIIDEEEQEVVSKGLLKFSAQDYMDEIQDLFISAFGELKPAMATIWI